MKRILKKILNKITSIPIEYTISFGAMILLLGVAGAQGVLDIKLGSVIVGIALLFSLYSYFGSIIAKTVVSVVLVTYLTSLYTLVVMNSLEFIIQPFLLTIAVFTAFIAQTYSSNNYSLGIRSRNLWSVILVLILVPTKMTLVMSDYGFWVTELIGLNVAILFTVIWRYWVKHSKKTKIVEPVIMEVVDEGVYRKIYINNTLDISQQKWTRGIFYTPLNSYPYIFNEVMKAYEDEKLLVIISKLVTSNLYDVGEIKINRSKTIPYLYMEAKADSYEDGIYDRFLGEVTEKYKFF